MAQIRQSQEVRDWMTPDPVTIGPKTTLPEAFKLMKEFNIRRLPIVHQGDLVGLVTWGNVRQASPSDATTLSIWELNYLLSQLTIDEIMSRRVFTVKPTDTIHEAASQMFEHKVSGLPVVEDGEVVGIVTESDIFRMIVQQWDRAEEGTESAALA
ncbi:MAG: CBS domain-containing protein [Chloroflexota bacterium]|nr:CBS domain-containing protein [Chloroflexota bacterium]